MTELADRFLLALRNQGYVFHVNDEDLVIPGKRGGDVYHVPRELLDDPDLELLLKVAIVSFAEQEGPRRFHLGSVLYGRPDPGRN